MKDHIQNEELERDYQTYKVLLDLWAKENPIKTTKLQVLLAVNALLVSGVNLSGGITADKWYVYLAAAVFCFIWMFSIGRTALFQDVWQIKLRELRDRYPEDSRFSVLETSVQQKQARKMLRVFGAVSSKWYLLFSPLIFGLAWLVVLIFTLTSRPISSENDRSQTYGCFVQIQSGIVLRSRLPRSPTACGRILEPAHHDGGNDFKQNSMPLLTGLPLI